MKRLRPSRPQVPAVQPNADCLDYLDWLRWPDGFVCPRCGHAGGWAVADGRYKCTGCGVRTSVTAGTLFDRRRTPLTVWFTACWMFASQKDGVSALSLKRALEIGSYPTAWAMLHRLRSVLVRPGRERLCGTVEVDETYIGGEEPGLPGGRAKGKKSLVGVAVEVHQPRGYGRVRIAILADASAASLHPFVTDNVTPGATVITDGWQGYRGIERLGYTHHPRSQRAARARGEDPRALLPGVHRIASWWRIENMFKYASEHNGIDALADYRMDIAPDTRMVTNPARLAARKQVKAAAAELAAAERALPQLLNGDGTPKQKNAQLPGAHQRSPARPSRPGRRAGRTGAHPGQDRRDRAGPRHETSPPAAGPPRPADGAAAAAFNAEAWLAEHLNTYLVSPTNTAPSPATCSTSAGRSSTAPPGSP